MVSIITCTMRNEFMENLFQNYQRQVWDNKELIIILNHDDMNIRLWKEKAKEYDSVSVYQKPNKVTLGECLNMGVKQAKYDYIAKFDDDDYYGAYYLTGIMQAFKNTEADIVGKTTTYCYFEQTKELLMRSPNNENKFVERVKGPTLVIKKHVFDKVKFPNVNTKEDSLFLKECRKKGFKIYSTDRYNFTYFRRYFNQHTSLISDNKIFKNSKFIAYTEDYKEFVNKKDFWGDCHENSSNSPPKEWSNLKKILYIGFLGYNNLGDELIWEIFKEVSRKYLNAKLVTIDAISPYSYSSAKKAVNNYDLIVLGGGSLLTPSYPYIKTIYDAVKNNKKVMIWGSGIDQIPTKNIGNPDVNKLIEPKARKILIKIIDHSISTGVRGPLTYNILKNIGVNMEKVNIIGDPGLLLNPGSIKAINSFLWSNNEKIIGLNWAIHKDKVNNKHEIEIENQLANTVRNYIRQGYKIYMYSLWNRDLEVSNRLYKKINDTKNVKLDHKLYHQNELMSLMKKFNFTINYRLHASIISVAAGTPYISVGNRFKDVDFAQSLNVKELVVSTDTLDIEQKINEAEKFIQKNRDQITKKFKNYIQKYNQKLIAPFKQNLFL
jgi:polysaccharide pyruvyl transferase WcaK-like protein/predicted peroxiredoxin